MGLVEKMTGIHSRKPQSSNSSNPIEPFWDSMLSSQDIPEADRQTDEWHLLQDAFERLYINKNPGTVSKPIPKIIHQIWIGKPMPKAYREWCKSWQKLNPGWEYRFWNEKEIDKFGLENRASYDASPNYGVKSDIVRYELLSRFGGIYADTDFECLQDFSLLLGMCELFAGNMYGKSPAINNGLIGAVPGHPVLRTMIDALHEPFKGHDGMEVLAYSGPVKFNAVILDHMKVEPQHKVLVFPTSFLYPCPNTNVDELTPEIARAWVQPESLAIHYWETSWKKTSLQTRLWWWLKRLLPGWISERVYKVLKRK